MYGEEKGRTLKTNGTKKRNEDIRLNEKMTGVDRRRERSGERQGEPKRRAVMMRRRKTIEKRGKQATAKLGQNFMRQPQQRNDAQTSVEGKVYLPD